MDIIKAFDDMSADISITDPKNEFAILTSMALISSYVSEKELYNYINSKDEQAMADNYCGLDYLADTSLYRNTEISIPILKIVDVLMAFGNYTYQEICMIINESILRLYYEAGGDMSL